MNAAEQNPTGRQAQTTGTAGLRSETRLMRIARALASGATVTDIAEAEGISRSTASRHVNSPECRQILAEFVSNEHELMQGMFYRALRVVEHAMSAKREYAAKDGTVFQGGPDHYARLAAVKHLKDLLIGGRPAPRQAEKQEPRQVTLEELEALLAQSESQKVEASR